MADDATISWQEAVMRLTAEKVRAETAARLIKQFANHADRASAEITYADGKAESDAVVVGLLVAFAERKQLHSLINLQVRMEKAVAARAALTELALAHVEAAKGVKAAEWATIIDAAKSLLPDLQAAVAALWNRRAALDDLLARTVETQLEAARWTDFPQLETK